MKPQETGVYGGIGEALDRWTAWGRLERPLLSGLARLAREGFVVPPEDGLDLIHDFLLEAWDSLQASYNPVKGTFLAYVHGAFLHFARRHVVRLRRMYGFVTDAVHLAQCRRAALELPPAQAQLLGRVQRAVDALPKPQAEVLRGYLGIAGSSERELAQAFGLTRYGLRELLINALGRVVVTLGEQGPLTSQEWAVANALWREGRTVRQTAALLHLTAPEVQDARQRVLRVLGTGLKGRDTASVAPRATISLSSIEEDTVKNADPMLTFREALFHPGQEALLTEIRRNAPLIRQQLHRHEVTWDEREQEALEQHGEWVAKVYEALIGDEPLPEEDQAMLEAMDKACQEDADEINHAFDLLAEGTDAASVAQLTSQVSTAAAKRTMEVPLVVWHACTAVTSLMDRLWSLARQEEKQRQAKEPQPHPSLAPVLAVLHDHVKRGDQTVAVTFGLPFRLASHERLHVPEQVLLAEMAASVECDTVTASYLLSWLQRVALARPYLFPGYEAHDKTGMIALLPFPAGRNWNVSQCWGRAELLVKGSDSKKGQPVLV